MEDTIVALATAIGESGVHIIRLSGTMSGEIIERYFRPKQRKRWESHSPYTLHLGIFHDGQRDLDQVLIGRMLAPDSFTGEDIYEINCHGGMLLAQRIMEVCLKGGARLAEAGEFTKRAFINGKLDLIQAEAVIDLISARTDHAVHLAFSQLQGGLSHEITELRNSILDVLAFIEAGIDFPEDDVEELDRTELLRRIQGSLSKTEQLLKNSKTGKILREGLKTAIVGRPNVGKSSLLNALLKEDRAIVTEFPGTTRDEIHESVMLGGILLHLIDTAGIRESQDVIERLGIERTWKVLPDADLIFLVVQVNIPLTREEEEILDKYGEKVIVIANKIDLLETPEIEPFSLRGVWLPFSVRQGKGFEELEKEVQYRVFQGKIQVNENILSNIRHIHALERAKDSLLQALHSLQIGQPWDILSIDVREAMQAVAEITGEDVQESLLEDIFSRFCIGK